MALTFGEVKELYADNNVPQGLKCIATPNGTRCDKDLSGDQILNLRDILNHALERMTLDEVRDVINCVICVDHQKGRNYRHKDKVQQKWNAEFPDLDFSRRRSRSRLSLSSGKSTPRRTSRSSVSPSHASTGRTPSSTRIGISTWLGEPPPQLQLGSRHMRSASAPESRVFDQPEAVSASSPAIHINDSIAELEEDGPESPLATRGRPQNPNPFINQTEAFAEGTDHSPRQRPASGSSLQARRELREPVRTPEVEQAAPPSTSGFENGEASAWAPWTIRSEVQDLVLLSMPHPDLQGSIYVVQVRNTERSIVKIGITYQQYKTRIGQVAQQHQQSFNMDTAFHRPGIPSLQLERLEKLVHADLAYYQRNWRVRTDRSFKTHHEYFEVDMKVAQLTVDLWRDIIDNLGLKAGVTLDRSLFKSLNADPDTGVHASNDADPATTWRRLNEDDNRRMELWRKHLLRRSHLVVRVIWWALGGFIMWAILFHVRARYVFASI